MAKSKPRRRGSARKGARKAARAGSARSTRRRAARGRRRSTRASKSRRKAGRSPAKSKSTSRKKALVRARKASAPKKRTARRTAQQAPTKRTAQKTAQQAPTKRTAPKTGHQTPARRSTTPRRSRPPTLDRERRTVREPELVPTPPSSLNLDRSASAAQTGRAELTHRLREHTSTGPALTGGDVDADWESAESVGDEAPGGDNPTPDQDVVDEIGKALGVEYDDDEELQGGEEIVERDRKRWELDPASRDDLDEE